MNCLVYGIWKRWFAHLNERFHEYGLLRFWIAMEKIPAASGMAGCTGDCPSGIKLTEHIFFQVVKSFV